MFSAKVLKALIEAGWYAGRCIDISKYVDILEKEGHSVPIVLETFLSEFGGLYLKVPNRRTNRKLCAKYNVVFKPYEIMHFDVSNLGLSGNAQLTRDDIFEPRVNEDLIIFGEIWDGRYWLTMTPSGKIYAVDNQSILMMGNDCFEMLENEFSGKIPMEIQ